MKYIIFNAWFVVFSLFLTQSAWADWVGPHKVISVSSAMFGEGITVTISGDGVISGCPERSIGELSWSAPGTDEEKDEMAGDMLISALMSAQAQGGDVFFDVLNPCSEGAAEFARVRLVY